MILPFAAACFSFPDLSSSVALAEIETNAGRLYDAKAADCLRLFRERGYTLPP